MILRLEAEGGAFQRDPPGSASPATVVAVRDGRFVDPATRPDRIVRVETGRFYPGLINAHDHLHRNHYSKLGSPPYEDAYAWGADIHAHCAAEIARAKMLDRRDALLFGALKNLLGGVTTVVHHDAWEPAFDGDFPLRLANVRTLHSLGLEPHEAVEQARAFRTDLPLCIHLAEGTNRRAANEIRQLDLTGLLDTRLLAVHAVGVDGPGITRLCAAGAGVVWCPTSNRFLFGMTAPRELFDSGIDILLGSDSLLTGDGTLLDELRAARRLGHIDDTRLLAAVGEVSARRLNLPVPSLEPGAPADVILVRTSLFDARPADIGLVLVGGRPVLADEAIARDVGLSGQPVIVGGVRKIVPRQLARATERAIALSAAGVGSPLEVEC
ncbi:MAG: amidohydrolase family protein [Gemmatimonas sp.]|nr:amidohydrolase family protein [Gemmatimonas sp.]